MTNFTTVRAMTINLFGTDDSQIQFTKIDDGISIEKITDMGYGEYQKEEIAMIMNKEIGNDWDKFEAFCVDYKLIEDEFFTDYDELNFIEVDEDGIVTVEFEKGDIYSVIFDLHSKEIKGIALEGIELSMSPFENDFDRIIEIIQNDEDLMEIIQNELEELSEF